MLLETCPTGDAKPETSWTHRDSAAGNAPREADAHGIVVLRRSEEHTSELQSQSNLVCRLLLEKKKHRPRSPLSFDTAKARSRSTCSDSSSPWQQARPPASTASRSAVWRLPLTHSPFTSPRGLASALACG